MRSALFIPFLALAAFASDCQYGSINDSMEDLKKTHTNQSESEYTGDDLFDCFNPDVFFY